MINRPL